ncbi:MAG: glycine zipper protein [Flavipsychrobacter sp.]|nr:glycine zipper protein [Flavipsychrobacter sp.]
MKLRTCMVMLIAAGMLGSCSSMNKTQKGAVIGGGSGAVVGGVIGRAAGNTAAGAIIGAAVGGAAGAIIGRKMDKQAEEIKNDVPGAEVERVGEGIVVRFDEAVLFSTASATLGANSTTSLNNLVTILNKYPDTNLEIAGHTDSRGTHEYNQGLSERRAQAVSGYLVNRGIKSARITTRGYGETQPIASNDTDAGRADNRRVEFQIFANEKMKQEAKSAAN